ncbi:MAG: FAD-dependent oxidoreductase, partial [Streptosporangiales bacterium]|nr:FAD-dependent oxidoreductase [Streptosporangiales bacterium]
DAGVALRLGAAVASVADGGVELACGGTVEADEVLTAVGVRPASLGLDGVPLRADGAVLVDEHLCAGPGVCAVGDVAAAWSPRYGVELRVEHWDNALRAPAVAAATLLGVDATYDPVPYVWSEQFGRYLQFVGLCRDGDELVWRGDPDVDRAWSACWVRDGRLAAVLAVDRPRDAVQGRRLAERGAPVDAVALADPAVPLKRAVPRVAD